MVVSFYKQSAAFMTHPMLAMPFLFRSKGSEEAKRIGAEVRQLRSIPGINDDNEARLSAIMARINTLGPTSCLQPPDYTRPKRTGPEPIPCDGNGTGEILRLRQEVSRLNNLIRSKQSLVSAEQRLAQIGPDNEPPLEKQIQNASMTLKDVAVAGRDKDARLYVCTASLHVEYKATPKFPASAIDAPIAYTVQENLSDKSRPLVTVAPR